MNGLKKWWKALNAFEKISVIIIPILVVIIVVTAVVIADKNDKYNQLKRKNDEITASYVQTIEIDNELYKTINLNE